MPPLPPIPQVIHQQATSVSSAQALHPLPQWSTPQVPEPYTGSPPPYSIVDQTRNSYTENFVGPERPIENDKTTPTILLAGLTGSGKSTLISHLTKDPVTIGHDLNSCTRDITTYTANISGQVVRLIDTPGFDDTNRSDSDILSVISATLAMLYREGVPLLGVLYLHRISDPRVSGASYQSLRILEAMVGHEAFGCILFATTMWDRCSREDGERRESELIANPKFFGTMCNFGNGGAASVVRLETREAAEVAVGHFLRRQGSTGQLRFAVLQIQYELVDKGLSLEETTAGMIIDAGLRQQQARHQEELRALQQELEECRNETEIEYLMAERQAQIAGIDGLSAAREGLKGRYWQHVDRMMPPHTYDSETESTSKEEIITASEIKRLRKEREELVKRCKRMEDSERERERAMHEVLEGIERNGMVIIQRQIEQLAQEERCWEQKRREARRDRHHRHGHRGHRRRQKTVDGNSWWRSFVGEGYSCGRHGS